MNKNIDILNKYATAFRDMINARVWANNEHPSKLLRINGEDDWNFICVAMDVVGDSALAIENFLKFSLDGPTRYNEAGERYLRLYGVLSAVYLQQESVRKLYSLMKCDKPKELKKEFDKLEIRTLRHQLASHSVDYAPQDGGKVQAFVPVRIGLSGFSCTVTENRGDKSRTVLLDKAIQEHCNLIVSVLDRIYEKSIITLFRGQENRIEEFKKKLDDLRFEKEGNLIFRANTGDQKSEIRIAFIKNT